MNPDDYNQIISLGTILPDDVTTRYHILKSRYSNMVYRQDYAFDFSRGGMYPIASKDNLKDHFQDEEDMFTL